jgi:hypothetical protein
MSLGHVPSLLVDTFSAANSQLDFGGLDNNEEEEDTVAKTSSNAPKRRQSLGPSVYPAVAPDLSNTITVAASRPAALPPRPPSNRRKKRQSILLPSTLPQPETADKEVTEYFETLRQYGTLDEANHVQETHKEASYATARDDEAMQHDNTVIQGMPETNKETPPNQEDTKVAAVSIAPETQHSSVPPMTLLRQLVRRYCALDPEQRGSSPEAAEIQRLAGYPLVLPHQYPSKQSLIMFLGPVVERMDQGTQEEKLYYQQQTQCRPERTRSGRMRYFHVETGQRVTPLNYQDLYLQAVEQRSLERRRDMQRFLQHHDVDVDWGLPVEEQTEDMDLDDSQSPANDDNNGESGEEEFRAKVNMNAKEYQDLVEVARSGEEESEHDENFETADGEKIDQESPQDTADEPLPVEEEQLSQSTRSFARTKPMVLLPLPPRDEVSSDPDILEAHQQLWQTIDEALETYSRTVLAIQAARELAEGEEGETSE